MTLNEAAETWLETGGTVVVNRYDHQDFQVGQGQPPVNYRDILYSPTDSLRFLSALMTIRA
jgi:hypothetical protein